MAQFEKGKNDLENNEQKVENNWDKKVDHALLDFSQAEQSALAENNDLSASLREPEALEACAEAQMEIKEAAASRYKLLLPLVNKFKSLFQKREEKNDSSEQLEEENYWKKIDQEFGLASQIFSHYLERSDLETSSEDILQGWLQELSDIRADSQESPVKDLDNDIIELRKLINIKSHLALKAVDVNADAVYTNKLMLLSCGLDGLPKEFVESDKLDQDDILEVTVNEYKRNKFYEDAKNYVASKYPYNINANGAYLEYYGNRQADEALVWRKLGLMDNFYENKDYYHYKTLPPFVADDLLQRGDSYQAYASQNISKFESFSPLVFKDMAARNIDYIFNNFERFPDANPVEFIKSALITDSQHNDEKIKNWTQKNIQSREDLNELYPLFLKFGIFIEDEDISPLLSVGEKEQYRQDRDRLNKELDEAAPPTFMASIDLDKCMQMVSQGNAAAVFNRLSFSTASSFDFDKLRVEMSKQKNTCLLLSNVFEKKLLSSDYLNIIKEGRADILARQIRYSHYAIDEEIALALVNEGYQDVVVDNISKFKNLSKKTADFLVSLNKQYLVSTNLSKFNLAPVDFQKIIDDNFSLIADNNNIKSLQKIGVWDYFLDKGLEHPKELLYLLGKDLTLLDEVEQEQVLQKLIDGGMAVNILGSLNFSNLNLTLSGDDFDQAVEANVDIDLFAKIKNKPADSFYVRQFESFDFNGDKRLLRQFSSLISDGILERNDSNLDLFLSSCSSFKASSSDYAFMAEYLKIAKNKTEAERVDFLQTLQAKANNISHNLPQNQEDEHYLLSLRLVYPQRNYDTYKDLGNYADKSSDLENLKFNPDGEKFALSGLTGYRLKEGANPDLELLTTYKRRVEEVKLLADADKLLEFLTKENPEGKAKSLEGRLLEYLDDKGYDSENMKVVLAYQLIGSYDQFISASADRLKESDDEDSKNYIMLDELLDRYGDNLKETIKKIQSNLSRSEDKDYLKSNNQEEVAIKLQNLGAKIQADLSLIPAEKISDDVIRRKIKKSLENSFQGHDFIKNNSLELAAMFSADNFNNFAQVWSESLLGKASLVCEQGQLANLEKAQARTYQEIQSEASKYEEIIEIDDDRKEKKLKKNREIVAYFSKNKENALARMVGDVCLATDSTMWEDKDYFEMVLFDQERNRCTGTVMLKTLSESKDKKYLLFCPNPSVGLVSEVSAKKLYNKLKDLTITFAQENNYQGVVLDKKHGRSTNRAGLFQKALERSVSKDDQGEEVVIDLMKPYSVGSYSYEKDLRAVYLQNSQVQK
ncbi:MAG: hypothetical protein PHE20_02610 [Patescibacteria group bacterium]|nr:hypothetical protein [Patescibacteria group bacterium]